MIKQMVLWAAAVALVGGCAAPRTYFEHDPKADFSHYKSYAIERNDQLLFKAREDLLGLNLRGQIESAIDAELAAKGFAKAASADGADFIVGYRIGIEQTAPESRGGGSVRRDVNDQAAAGNNPYVPLESPRNDGVYRDQRTGTLVVEVIDPKTHAGVWRGTRAQTLPDKADDEDRTKRLTGGVKELLGRFPPR